LASAVNVNVNDVSEVLDTATFVGGLNVVVADTEFESADVYPPLIDRIVIGEYVVEAVSPVTDVGLVVTLLFTETPFT
jgi:hypothetical protein